MDLLYSLFVFGNNTRNIWSDLSMVDSNSATLTLQRKSKNNSNELYILQYRKLSDIRNNLMKKYVKIDQMYYMFCICCQNLI